MLKMSIFPSLTKTMMVCAIGMLSACSISDPVPITRDHRSHAPALGVWQVANCKAYAYLSDMTLVTDGRLSNNTVRIVLETRVPLLSLPQLSFSTMHDVISPSGSARHYAFEIPYEAHTIAKMQDDAAAIIITYQPAGRYSLQQQHVALKGLPFALVLLENDGC